MRVYALISLVALILQALAVGPAWALEPAQSRSSIERFISNIGSDQAGVPQAPSRPVMVPHRPQLSPPRPATAAAASSAVRPSPTLMASPVPARPTTEPRARVGTPLRAAAPPLSVREDLRDRRSGVGPLTIGSRGASESLEAPKTALRRPAGHGLQVKAGAMYCVDCTNNRVVLAENTSQPMPIASITKLLTAMTVIDEMKLDAVLDVPSDIQQVDRHRVGIRPGERFTVSDLLHGMLIESGNDCAEVLARAYPKGGREGFMSAMNRRAARIGAAKTTVFTPSGLDMKFLLGRKDGRNLETRRPNTASAEDVAAIAKEAFTYPLIRRISSMKSHTMRTQGVPARDYPLASNDKLLSRNLPVAGAKTGFTSLAGRCIVARFTDDKKDYMVVVLNSPHHFKAAEKIYRWACKTF